MPDCRHCGEEPEDWMEVHNGLCTGCFFHLYDEYDRMGAD